ncbi:MAG: cytochrome c3 family protein [Gemmatimonadota bacterium]
MLGPERVVATGWPMNFSTGDAVLRDVPFQHQDHLGTDCGECHQEGSLELAPDVASCNNCHQEHHEAPTEVSCMTCHREPEESAHTVESHLGCTGSGCHLDPPLALAPRNRTGCLVCHQDLTDHRPEGECVECHALPAPTGGSP